MLHKYAALDGRRMLPRLNAEPLWPLVDEDLEATEIENFWFLFQAWKRQRLIDLGFGIPSFLRLVPVDFEAGDAWWERLAASGFDSGLPAVVASTGVSMYLTRDAIAATLRRVAALAGGSTLAMSFMLPIELADPEMRPGIERALAGARANGTPFISFFTPTENADTGSRCRL
jgi:O-methyltransferase involved in polyketide biosynthesis